MPKLSDLLSTREITSNASNLEKGKVWVMTVGSSEANARSDSGYCWRSPGCGTLTIETWGAAGGGARMCCCGFGLPGNPPGYARKQIAVFPDSHVCGCPGVSCKSHSLCFDGCGVPSYLCWSNARDLCGFSAGCMCAGGGKGGNAICSPTTGGYCCFVAAGFCHTLIGSSCGIICNACPGHWMGCGYGGDIGCCGQPSCVIFKGTGAVLCPCQTDTIVATSPQIFSDLGANIIYTHDDDNEHTQWSGNGYHSQAHTLNFASKSPAGGIPFTICYNGNQGCGCYEANGCNPTFPYGVPGNQPWPCPDVRDHGRRGGHGAIRLTYRGSGIMSNLNTGGGKLGGAY